MNEVVMILVGLVAGGALTWMVRGSIAQTAIAAAQTRMDMLEHRLISLHPVRARERLSRDAAGEVKINDNALVALALLIAESEPRNKELMIRLVMNLLVEKPRMNSFGLSET